MAERNGVAELELYDLTIPGVEYYTCTWYESFCCIQVVSSVFQTPIDIALQMVTEGFAIYDVSNENMFKLQSVSNCHKKFVSSDGRLPVCSNG